jgi:hypothetical protein
MSKSKELWCVRVWFYFAFFLSVALVFKLARVG